MPNQKSSSKKRRRPKENTSAFFETLPRELRDSIYDLLYKDVEHKDWYRTLRIRAPLATLRLVSHQFKLEYEERFLQNKHLSRLIIKDQGDFEPKLMKCPNIAFYTTNLTINLYACHGDHFNKTKSCESTFLLPKHGAWMDEFVQNLPHLRSIRSCLAVVWNTCIDEIRLALASITSIPQVVEVRLRCAGCPNPHDVTARNPPTIAFWTRETGFVRDDEAIEVCLRTGPVKGIGWLLKW